ncbi:MAG: SNF2-related protein [Cellvibrionaceae bacterium]
MQNPQIGQRWLVDTDASLGLGIIIECETRRVTLEFPATGESRQYSRQNAPLTRAVFGEGDTIETAEGSSHQVSRVETINDLLIYIDQDGHPVPESQLAATVQLNHPLKRLLAAQLDKPAWFDVREQLSRAYQQWLRSDVIGLLGARITLTPHQLYVAQSATSRHPVRVLLADEVGLGKTIEAGLILQRLQLQHFVGRTLILVPEALCVQWFVELLRCFSIHSVLIDAETELSELNDSRVFIASHSFLDEARPLDADPWDMVIIDEAHHFDLVEENLSGEQLKKLASHTKHLLLLSATPERLGLESHFARLQLLDAEKFYNFDEFKQAYDSYQSLADDLHLLLDEGDDKDSDEHVSKEQLERLQQHFSIDIDAPVSKSALTELLLDGYGTGRMVYRNTRHAVAGFPERKLISHTIDGEEQKLEWLAGFIKQYKNEKLLLITHDKEDVLDLREWLYRKTGVDCPVFHEDMTLIERDRAAAYFADAEEGAPLLLCSEIGSEGRNFQFCHRLVCWDLPEHPDVLEQRIGRLDRIGQTHNIEVHVCVESDLAAQRLHWFHDVLSSIEQINPAAGSVHDRWYHKYTEKPDQVEPIVKAELSELLQQLEQGRDRLLEMNSCRQPDAKHLVETITDEELSNNPKELLENIADVLNLHYEQLDLNRYRIVPSDQMLVPMIPGIPMEGCEITFDRDTATSREDIEFITWDHPLMQGLAEMISVSDLGVAGVGLFPNKNLRPGMLFAEVLFNVSVQSSHTKQIERYLTQSGLRVVVTVDNPKNFAAALPSEQLSWLVETAGKPIRKAVVKDYREQISALAEQAEKIATTEITSIIDSSLKQLRERSQLEVARLRQLQKRNDSISDDDIQNLQDHYDAVEKSLKESCKPVFGAIRLLVTYKPD